VLLGLVDCAGAASGSAHPAGAPAAEAGASSTNDASQAEAGMSTSDAMGSLRVDVAPGGNFDLSRWELQEPVGAAGNPTTISPAALSGPNGYHDSYFFTDPSDGAMTFWDPENGVTTANSSYPRSELREMNPDGTAANWPLSGTNTLTATLAVTQVPDHVCVGQVHVGTALEAGVASSTKPLLELYAYANGNIVLGLETSPAGSQTTATLATVPLGTRFSYVIQLTGAALTVTINGATSTFAVPASFAGYGEYFKAGDYDQTAGTDPTVGATVKFYALSVTHGP